MQLVVVFLHRQHTPYAKYEIERVVGVGGVEHVAVSQAFCSIAHQLHALVGMEIGIELIA